MKKLLLSAAFIVASLGCFAQVGIGTATVHATAELELLGAGKGVIVPRMGNAGRDNMVAAKAGILIYNTDTSSFQVSTSTSGEWLNITGGFTVTAGTAGAANAAGTGKVGIGTTSPNLNTALDVISIANNKGILMPRGTADPTGAAGMVYYNTTDDKLRGFNGTTWNDLHSLSDLCTVTIKDGPNPEDLITFMCHNLGADTSILPNMPNQATAGDYFQWGRKLGVATAYTDAAAITGWSIVAAVDGSWGDGSKTVNDPCPAGFRVPTETQWLDVLANNTRGTNLGGFAFSATSFGSAMVLTGNGQSLILPANGERRSSTGWLNSRGGNGKYWSSTEYGTNNANLLNFFSNNAATNAYRRVNGFSVRCVSE